MANNMKICANSNNNDRTKETAMKITTITTANEQYSSKLTWTV